MTPSFKTRILQELEQCLLLGVNLDDAEFTVCLAIAEPDINLVADILPPRYFENDANVHVAALTHPDDAGDTINDITFALEPGDTVVFLCIDEATFDAALALFDQV